MSGTTVRKLRRISDGVDTGYILLPPKNWLDAVEKAESKKIVAFTVRAMGEDLVLKPTFEEPKIKKVSGNSSEDVVQMMRQGNLTVKLRDFPKGRIVYRVVKVPRAWVRVREGMRRRKLAALSIKTEPDNLLVSPIFGDKLKD
jgi:hypothetical protein